MSGGEHGTSTSSLLARAHDDVLLLQKVVSDAEVSDSIIGFHAQQAVEKALKAVLETRGIDYPRTHDLARLLGLLDGSGGAPNDRDGALALTPWATELRYGDVIAGSLNRAQALAIAEAVLDWAQDEITP